MSLILKTLFHADDCNDNESIKNRDLLIKRIILSQ